MKRFTINCIGKILHQKKLDFKRSKTYIEQSKYIFSWKEENDPIGGRGSFSCKRMYAIVFFSQFHHKVEIKQMSNSDNQNCPFPSPPYS